MRAWFGLGVALLLTAALGAHEGLQPKAAEAAKDAGTQVKAAGVALAKDAQALGQATGAAASQAVDQAKTRLEVQAEPLDLLRQGLTKHVHNTVAHFALALGVVGALFFLMSLRKAQYLSSARILLALAAAAGALAVPTGEHPAEAFEAGRLHDTLHLHATLGKVSLGLVVALLILSFMPSTRKWSWLVAVAALLVVLVAGGLGGVLATS